MASFLCLEKGGEGYYGWKSVLGIVEQVGKVVFIKGMKAA